MRLRNGLVDLIGFAVVAVVVVWWPGFAEPLNLPKLLVLSGIGLGLIPLAIWRTFVLLREKKKNQSAEISVAPFIVMGAAALLAIWVVLSTIFSEGPKWAAITGWLGRSDGLLSWISVIAIFLVVATMTSPQIQRLTTWLLTGVTIVAIIGVFQYFEFEPVPIYGRRIIGTMGNTNFSAGYYGLVIAVVVARALTRGAPILYRLWAAALALVLGALIFFNGDAQGPLAAGISLGAMAIIYAFAYQGRQQLFARILGIAATLGIGAVAVLGILGHGPLLRVTQDASFLDRLEFWKATWPMALDNPWLGVGPGRLALYLAEYRPEDYVQNVSVSLIPSASHNIALQVAGTLGLVALTLWIMVFVGAAIVVAVRMFRGPLASPILAAGIGGSLVGYLAQGFVSIDMLPLLVMGWTLAGMAVALAREPRDAQAATQAPPKTVLPTPVAIGGIALSVVGFGLVGIQMVNVNQTSTGDLTPEQVTANLINPLTPCVVRAKIVKALSDSGSGIPIEPVLKAVEIDPRCSGMANVRSQIALQQGDLELANRSTLEEIQFDPLRKESWLSRARYLIAAGDFPEAKTALSEATRVTALNESAQGGYENIEELRAAIPN